MPKWLRAIIAGYGAKKLGGGCFSTILVFIVIYYALGQCNRPAQPVRQGLTPAKTSVKTAYIQPAHKFSGTNQKTVTLQ